jgi:hypothetical protein
MRPWRRRKETLGIFSLYAKRYKSVYISVNNNTNLNLFKILSNYIIWNRLSQKTISRYCPFKAGVPVATGILAIANIPSIISWCLMATPLSRPQIFHGHG